MVGEGIRGFLFRSRKRISPVDSRKENRKARVVSVSVRATVFCKSSDFFVSAPKSMREQDLQKDYDFHTYDHGYLSANGMKNGALRPAH